MEQDPLAKMLHYHVSTPLTIFYFLFQVHKELRYLKFILFKFYVLIQDSYLLTLVNLSIISNPRLLKNGQFGFLV